MLTFTTTRSSLSGITVLTFLAIFQSSFELVRARSNSLFANHPVANVLNSYARQIARHNTPPPCPWRNNNRIESIRLFLFLFFFSLSFSLSFSLLLSFAIRKDIVILSQRNVSIPAKKEKRNGKKRALYIKYLRWRKFFNSSSSLPRVCNVMKNNGSLGITRHVGVEGGGRGNLHFLRVKLCPTLYMNNWNVSWINWFQFQKHPTPCARAQLQRWTFKMQRVRSDRAKRGIKKGKVWK